MRKPTSLFTEAATITVGFKAAAVVVLLSVLAATVDHATPRSFTGPLLTDHAVPTAYTETLAGGFDLPVDLHPNQGDVTAPVATF